MIVDKPQALRATIICGFVFSFALLNVDGSTAVAEETVSDDAPTWVEGAHFEAPEVSDRGPSYVLQSIRIVGNRKTMDQTITRNIDLQPGETFYADDSRLEKARYRLLASGLFHEVDFSLEKGEERGYVSLKVKVKERNTIVVQDIVFGLSEMNPGGTFSDINPYGSLDIAERNLFGSGVTTSAAGVWSEHQYGYRLRFSSDHFANSNFGFQAEGWFAHARDFFGNTQVCKFTCPCGTGEECPDTSTEADYGDYVPMEYNRTGFKIGTGYAMKRDTYFSLDYRLDIIDAAVPPWGSHVSFGERRPIVYGHLLPGHSFVSSLSLGLVRDTRNSFILASEGSRTVFGAEIATEIIGSDYDFSKFTMAHDVYFPLPRGHSIKLGLFLGLIMGDAPFFNQFFVGDFSAFVPSRVLEMNFSPLQPNLLETSIVEMRYEDLATSIGLEYSIPLYRGQNFFYGINGFIGAGVFALASQEYLKLDNPGYEGYKAMPMDLTLDLGIKVDTKVGLFIFSLANMFRMIPSVGGALTE